MLLHLALHKDRASLRIEAGGEKVQSDLKRIRRDVRCIRVVGGQRVQISDEEVALVLVLQLDSVGQGAHVVAEVQLSCGAHAAQNARAGR